MFAIIQAVGWPIWPLILASVIAVALIIERSITLRRARIVPPGLLDNVLADLRQGGVSTQMIERVAAHSPLGRVLAAGLRNVNSAREVMKDEPPGPLAPLTGCAFHPRCPHAMERCRRELPQLRHAGPARAACHALEEGRLAF